MIDKNNNFNAIRLFAALQVVYMHTIAHLGLWPGPEWLFDAVQSFPGVPIFFVISGFLVAESYLNSKTAGEYAVKRMVRIYPALIVNIAVMEFLIFLPGGFAPDFDPISYFEYFSIYAATASLDWARYLIDWHYISMGFFNHYPSGVLWTLSVELTFYLVLPLILEMWCRSRSAGIIYLITAMAGSLFLAHHFNVTDKFQTFVSLSIGPYFWVFGIGVAARLSWKYIKPLFENRTQFWIGAHVLLLIYSLINKRSPTVLFQSPDLIDFFRVAVLAGSVLSLAFTWPRPDLLKGYDISYGVYLYHMLILYTMISLGCVGRLRYWPLALGASILAGLLSWLLVERPASRLRRLLSWRPGMQPPIPATGSLAGAALDK